MSRPQSRPCPSKTREAGGQTGQEATCTECVTIDVTPGSRAVWGPSAWRIVHWLAMHHPERLSDTWLDALVTLLPCSECQDHLRANLQSLPPPATCLFKWSVRLHNRVNGQLGKRRMTLAAARVKHASPVLTSDERRPFCVAVVAKLPGGTTIWNTLRTLCDALDIRMGDHVMRSKDAILQKMVGVSCS